MIKIKAKVSKDACIGCGACQAIAPDVFELNDEGIAEVIVDEIKSELEDDVQNAADSCPTSAIELKENN